MAHVKGIHKIFGTRKQFRSSIARVDPEGLLHRREQFGKRLQRRKYLMLCGTMMDGTNLFSTS